MAITLHLAQRLADDHLETAVRRGGIAGKAEDGRTLHQAERLSFAGTHVHGGHEQLARSLNHRLDEVEIAVCGTAGRDHEIIGFHRIEHRLLKRLVSILHDGKDGGNAAGRLRTCRDGKAV